MSETPEFLAKEIQEREQKLVYTLDIFSSSKLYMMRCDQDAIFVI